MDLGNVRKYDIDTLKSLHNELNESNVESGGWIVTATDEKTGIVKTTRSKRGRRWN